MAKVLDRIEKNRKAYAKELEIFKQVIKADRATDFMHSMVNAIITGRVITPKMDTAIKNVANREDPETRATRKSKIEPLVLKIRNLEDIIRIVDEGKLHHRFSSLNFIVSVKLQLLERLSLSEKQMISVNDVHKRYKPKYDKIQNSQI